MTSRTFKKRRIQLDLEEKLNAIIEKYHDTGVLEITKLVIEAFPGSGKSSLPYIAGRMLIDAGIVDKVCWVVPRTALKKQGAEEGGKLYIRQMFRHGLELREVKHSNDAEPTRECDGYITTYQSLVSAKANNLKKENNNNKEFRRYKYLLFLDECHHTTPDKSANPDRDFKNGFSFYKAVQPLFEKAAFRICASGLIKRHGNQTVGFVDYIDSIKGGENVREPKIDIQYTYRNALDDKAAIPLFYNTGSAKLVEYTKNKEKKKKYKIENGDDVRVALETEYGEELLNSGIKAWQNHRHTKNPRAKLIIVTKSQSKSKSIQTLINSLGLDCALAISDEPKAHDNIKRFRKNPDCKVIATCQMAYEGLDCKEATHVIVLTDIRSHPWLLQLLTRIMRSDTHEDAIAYDRQYAIAYCPDDEPMMSMLRGLKSDPDTSIPAEDELADVLNIETVLSESDKEYEAPVFEDCKSEFGGVTQHDGDGNKLPPVTLAKVEQYSIQNNIQALPIEVYKILRNANALHLLESIGDTIPISTDEVISTVREREDALKEKIQNLTSKLDHHFGCEFGHWNKKSHNKFRFKSRKDMGESELKEVLKWLNAEARREQEGQNPST